MNKQIILLRSVSGAGKSTFAKLLTSRIGWVSVCADDYFTDADGNYNFDATKLSNAHAECKVNFMEALAESTVEGIVVANTNTTPAECKFYEQEAKKVGATVFHIVMENRHGNSNVHNVPVNVLERQEANIRNSLQLA
jgi:predicted kinase